MKYTSSANVANIKEKNYRKANERNGKKSHHSPMAKSLLVTAVESLSNPQSPSLLIKIALKYSVVVAVVIAQK